MKGARFVSGGDRLGSGEGQEADEDCVADRGDLKVRNVVARLTVFGKWLCYIGALLVLSIDNVTFAQGRVIDWTEPVNLSNTEVSSSQPAVAVDPYGNVHVFWSEDVGGELVERGTGPRTGNTIYYTRWDGKNWSEPIDIFFTTAQGNYFGYPSVAVTPDGFIHLAWRAVDGIHYSHVPAYAPPGAGAWAAERIIAQAAGEDSPRLVADSSGGLHLTYARWRSAVDGQKDGNVYYQNSVDGGLSWSSPIQVSTIPLKDKAIAGLPRLAIQNEGKIIHLVWYEVGPPDWIGGKIFYARSLDGGQSWTWPLDIAHVKGAEKWTSHANIGVGGKGEIVITWVCGESAGRCSRQSQDRGQTWNAARHVFGDLISLAGWDTLVSDGMGNLYWILQLRFPEAMYYSVWTDRGWSDPPVPFITSGPMAYAHYPDATIRLGNKISLVMVDQNIGEIYYASGQTDGLANPPAPTPSPILTLHASATPPPERSPMSTASSAADLAASAPPSGSFGGPGAAVLAGVLPVAILIGLVVIGRFGLKRRH